MYPFSFSWKCFRGQKLETKLAAVTAATPTATTQSNPKLKSSSDWLDDADDWGSDEDLYDVTNNGDIGSSQVTAKSYDDPVGQACGSSITLF